MSGEDLEIPEAAVPELEWLAGELGERLGAVHPLADAVFDFLASHRGLEPVPLPIAALAVAILAMCRTTGLPDDYGNRVLAALAAGSPAEEGEVRDDG